MKKNVVYLMVRVFVFAILILPASMSFAAVDNFTPYTYASTFYNSNIVRVADDAEAIAVLGSTKTQDMVQRLGVGFRAELPVSRQRLRADVDISRVTYETLSALNHTQTEARAVWRWQVGNLWSGNLGYRYRKRLSSFYELQSVLKDLKIQNITFLDVGYQLHPDWRLVVSLSQSDQTYQVRKRLERELKSELLELQYRNTINTRMSLRVKVTEANLLNLETVVGSLVNNDFKETEISGKIYWEGSNKSYFEAILGVTDNKYDELKERDFQGSIGRVTYQWLITRLTKLDFSLWQEADSKYSEETTTFVVTKGISISPTWSATRKITVNGKISYTKADFEGDSGVILGSGQEPREDSVRLFYVDASYAPERNVSWSLSYQNEVRTSNIQESEFKASQINARVQLSF